jgi:hypothetical protein
VAPDTRYTPSRAPINATTGGSKPTIQTPGSSKAPPGTLSTPGSTPGRAYADYSAEGSSVKVSNSGLRPAVGGAVKPVGTKLAPRDLYDRGSAKPAGMPAPTKGVPVTTKAIDSRYKPQPTAGKAGATRPMSIEPVANTPDARAGGRAPVAARPTIVDRFTSSPPKSNLPNTGTPRANARGTVAAAPRAATLRATEPRLVPRGSGGATMRPYNRYPSGYYSSSQYYGYSYCGYPYYGYPYYGYGSCYNPCWNPCYGYGFWFGVGFGASCWCPSWSWSYGYYSCWSDCWYDTYCYPSYWWNSYWWWPSSIYCPSWYYAGYPTSSVVVVERGEPEQVVAAGRVTRDPTPAELARQFVDLGDYYFKEARFADAVEAYTKAANHAPGDAPLQFLLADALFATGDYHHAAYRIVQALRLDPALATVDTDKRLAYGDLGLFERQMQTLMNYLAEKPYDAMAHLVLGYNLKFSGKPEDAKKAFQRVLEIDPTSAAAKTFLDAIEAARRAAAPPAGAPAAGEPAK